MRDLVLAFHVGAGAGAQLLGPLALLAREGRQRRLALAYQGAVATVTATAVVLASLALDELWWLIFLAVGTESLALGGHYVTRAGSDSGIALRAHMLGGSYIALVTALLAVSWGAPAGWALPSLVGVPAIVLYHASKARSPTSKPLSGG
jgi:hypothetical protein